VGGLAQGEGVKASARNHVLFTLANASRPGCRDWGELHHVSGINRNLGVQNGPIQFGWGSWKLFELFVSRVQSNCESL
jgi:hypothetical protein